MKPRFDKNYIPAAKGESLFSYLIKNGVDAKRAEQVATVYELIDEAVAHGYMRARRNKRGAIVALKREDFERWAKTIKPIRDDECE